MFQVGFAVVEDTKEMKRGIARFGELEPVIVNIQGHDRTACRVCGA